MTPVLFNLYTCLLMEHWIARVEDVEGAGVPLKFRVDKKLFRRYIRNADERMLTDCLFADDRALLAFSRNDAEKILSEYQMTGTKFRLTVSIPKTKQMVVGREATESDKTSTTIDRGEIEAVEEFSYLVSIFASSGAVDMEVDARIAKASRALRRPVFVNKDLKVATKRRVDACVLLILFMDVNAGHHLKSTSEG